VSDLLISFSGVRYRENSQIDRDSMIMQVY
jgi:hypothetical protein